MKSKIKIFGFILITTISASAQDYDENAWNFAKTIESEQLKEHLYTIASDEFEGRETGKKGQKMAMEYLIENFKSYGIDKCLEKGYTQEFTLLEQEQKGVQLKIVEQEFLFNKDFTLSPSVVLKQQLNEELVFIGYGIEEANYDSYKKRSIKGKAVFIMDGLPENVDINNEWTIKKKIELAKEKGAAVVMYYKPNLKERLEKYEHYYSKPKLVLEEDIKNDAVVVAVTEEMTEAILKMGKLKLKKIFKKGVSLKDGFSIQLMLDINKPTKELTSENVLAYIPGKELKEELIIITAHYDHIGKEGDVVFNGADDDGTGTVSLLEIAEAFQTAVKKGLQPKRSILIMPVSGEEKGLLGSKYYTSHPIFPLENTVANLNIDMIGRYDKDHENDSNYVYLIGSDKLSSDLHELSESINETYTQIGLDYKFNDENDPNRFYYRSDHYNFAKNNIPVIFYFSGVHEDYHKATDTVEKIDYKKTEKIARLVFMTAWELANRNERIKLDEKINK